MTIKATYERPAFKKVGSIEAITKSTAVGRRLDAAFANNTPLAEVTLS